MPLKAGTLADYSGSLAADIERAFLAEWDNHMPGQAPPEPNPQMRLMFVAVAQGLVQYLLNHPDSFRVSVSNGNITLNGTVIGIDTTGTLSNLG